MMNDLSQQEILTRYLLAHSMEKYPEVLDFS